MRIVIICVCASDTLSVVFATTHLIAPFTLAITPTHILTNFTQKHCLWHGTSATRLLTIWILTTTCKNRVDKKRYLLNFERKEKWMATPSSAVHSFRTEKRRNSPVYGVTSGRLFFIGHSKLFPNKIPLYGRIKVECTPIQMIPITEIETDTAANKSAVAVSIETHVSAPTIKKETSQIVPCQLLYNSVC